MPLPVYSVLIWEGVLPVADFNILAFVPGGYVWVVRHISAFNPAVWPTALNGVEVQDGAGIDLFAVGRPLAYSQRWYRSNMHQVVEGGDLLQSSTADSQWRLRISGYQLTLP